MLSATPKEKTGTIPLMTASDPSSAQSPKQELKQDPNQDNELFAAHTTPEPRSWMPWILASVFVLLVLLLLVLLSRHSGTTPVPGGTGMAAAAPYAGNLPITNLEMSQATSFAGTKVTYIDGTISNSGSETMQSITVQVGFRNDLGQLSQRTVMPLTLIRTRQPYVDIEPVSADPLKPGDHKDFRLIFDGVPNDWNQQLPEIRIIAVNGK